ncbi:hypothetical protein ACS0TY_032994 [Phlomoides rotata]
MDFESNLGDDSKRNRIIDHENPSPTFNTYDVIFFGESIFTVVTCEPSFVTEWISNIEKDNEKRNLVVGLDIKWRPSYDCNVNNPAATIQLCVDKSCLIFQLIHTTLSIPKELFVFLDNPDYKFVGVGVKDDLEKLKKDYELGSNTKSVDLRELAAEKHGKEKLKNYGLKELASLVLGKEMEKPKEVTISRWDAYWLTPLQVQYACISAYVSFKIGECLMAYGS